MKMGIAAAFLAFFLLLPSVRADDLDASVEVQFQDTTGTVDLDKYGKGKEEVKTPTFTVQLSNTGLDDLSAIDLKLYVVGAHNWVANQNDRKSKPRVLQVLVQKGLQVGASQVLSVPLGKVEIKSTTTTAVDPGRRAMNWFGGYSYAGYVLEIYLHGKLSQTKMVGSDIVRPTYEAFLKHGGKETE